MDTDAYRQIAILANWVFTGRPIGLGYCVGVSKVWLLFGGGFVSISGLLCVFNLVIQKVGESNTKWALPTNVENAKPPPRTKQAKRLIKNFT